MKILADEIVEIVTPCFCSGADQNKAEIRSPSIRGELRWWFRVLGGTQNQEQNVFGGISGDNGSSSAVVIRVTEIIKTKSESNKLTANQSFFTSSRTGDKCMIPAGRQFRLKIMLRRKIETKLLTEAIDAMLLFGAIGLRSNRGCGALQAKNNLPTKDEFSTIKNNMIARGVEVFSLSTPEKTFHAAVQTLEETLKKFRKEMNVKKNSHNALGFVDGSKRHGSCLRLRPVALRDGSFLPVFVYTEKVLGTGTTGILPELKMFF